MKNLIFTGASLLLLAATTQAQIFQQGDTQFAQQVQNGPNQTGSISQQQGTGTNYGNYAITFQGTSSNTGANTVTINQNGGPVTSAPGVLPPTIGPGQGSQGNRGAITQNGGPGNTATINQNGGPDGISGGGLSTSATLGAAGGDGNFAGILQQGMQNQATINENNNSRQNFGEVYQNGAGLKGTINQSNGSVNNKATVNQGFSGNMMGAAITNAEATINQGKINAGDMSAGPAIAESIGNTATITQTVSNVKAFIAQGSSNLGDSNPPGRAEGSMASITQSAQNGVNGSAATVLQGAFSGESIGSRATLTITGENNPFSHIVQGYGASGSDNGSTASITMAGTSSNAYINQAFNGQTDGDQATITQSSGVQFGSADIAQGAGINTFSRNDKATIVQTGQGDISQIFQNSNFGNSNQANGSDNIATVMQMNGVSNVRGIIVQGLSTGGSMAQAVRNQAAINQTGGTGHKAYIGQGTDAANGSNPTGGPDLTGTRNGTNSGNLTAVLGLIAIDNVSTINQSGGTNMTATILQSGRNNQGTINQSAGSNSNALIVQTDNSRFARAVINQSSTNANNQAKAFQFAGTNADGKGGFGNQIEINQVGEGTGNIAIAQQGYQGATSSSNDNFFRVTQNGSYNQARMLQVGNSNFVDLTQNGSGNELRGEDGPGSTASQIGYGNRLTLVQNGGPNGQIFQYKQIGNNNTQIVNQSPQ